MRIVFVSTHTDQTTGYSKVAFNMLKQLATLSPKVKTFHFGFQRHPNQPGFRKLPPGIIQYDAAANEDPKEEGFGFNKIKEYVEMVNPDVVLIYNDPLIIHRFVESMKHDRASSTYKLWVYVDQVYEGIAQPLMDTIRNHADRVYVFTDLWKQILMRYGTFNDVHVLEHAVDPSMFSNMTPDARMALRSNLGIPANGIVFLNANRNSQRKRLDLTIQGFTALLAKDPERPYYLIITTNASPQSGAFYDIPRIFTREVQKYQNLPPQILTRLILIDTAPPNVIGDDGINQIYNVADIGINTSDGEGFGLCQLEHMFTGAPQIVTDVGSYRTFMDDNIATFVPAGTDVYFAGNMPLGGWSPSFSPVDVTTAMERTIENLSDMKKNLQLYKFKTWSEICDNWLEDVLTA